MKKLFIVNFILVIVILTLGNVNAATMNNYNWDLHFENIEIADGSIAAIQEPTIIGSSNSEIVYSVDFNAPGEFYEFTVDVINNGTLDAIVGDINQNKLTVEQEKYLSYKLTYLDGTEVNRNDLLKAGTKNRLRIRLEFRKDITIDDLPKEDTNIFFSLNSCYVQANENDIESNEDNIKSIYDFIKNPKTGDFIITYVVIFIFAWIALFITKNKSRKVIKKNKKV